MAYHFRKLKQALRIIPSTKSIGFSTRVNEGDQTKNLQVDGNPVRVQCETVNDQSALVLADGLASNSLITACTVLQTPSDLSLVNFFRARTASLPVVYQDIAQVLLPRSLDNDSEENDPVFRVAKSIMFTSDDILVHLSGSFRERNTTVSTREQISIDVLTRQHYHRLAQEAEPSVSHLDSGILCDIDAGTFTGSDIRQTHVCYSSNTGIPSKQKGNGNSKDGPSPDQMHQAKDKLEQLVKTLFKGSHNYEMLHKHVVMENNLFGDNKISIGMGGYRLELLKLRLRIHTQLFSTSMEILSITSLEQTGVIRIHWRLKGLPQIQNLKFWRLFQSRETICKDDWEWLEAFSYFHIGKDGLVHKHRIDRMMPDDYQSDLTEKLRGLLNPAKPLVN